jgi:hypothetical protein
VAAVSPRRGQPWPTTWSRRGRGCLAKPQKNSYGRFSPVFLAGIKNGTDYGQSACRRGLESAGKPRSGALPHGDG